MPSKVKKWRNMSPMTADPTPKPRHLELDKQRGLTITWQDGAQSFYPVAYLRRMSPSADARELRKQMAANPLTVLPSTASPDGAPLTATGIDMVGRYAVRITFSDGHDTGLYSWDYLREIDPKATEARG